MYFEAAAAAVTPDPEVAVGSPKVTVLELGLGTDGFGSWCGIYGSTVRQRISSAAILTARLGVDIISRTHFVCFNVFTQLTHTRANSNANM